MLRSLTSFDRNRGLLETIYDTVVASAKVYVIVCLGRGITDRDRKRLNCQPESVGGVAGRKVVGQADIHHEQDFTPPALHCRVPEQLLQSQTVTPSEEEVVPQQVTPDYSNKTVQ